MKEKKKEQWRQKFKEAVQTKVDEQVLGAGPFYRAGSWAGAGLAQISGAGALGASLFGKKKAAGLPQNFIIAVTPTKVYAFGYKPRSSKVKVKDELAVWDRANLKVTTEEKTMSTRVVFESPGEGEKVECDTGKDDFTAPILSLLQDPTAT